MQIRTKILIVLFVLFLNTSALAETIHVVPGPVDGCKIITPWGDFIAIQNGSSIWVGTVAEYEDARIRSILKKNGEKEVKLEGISGPNNHGVVSTQLPSTSVGAVKLYNIYTTILFGAGPDKKEHRPPKPPKTEYIDIDWVQSQKASITPVIYDLETHETFKPYETVTSKGTHFSEFIIPRDSLGHKAALVFTYKKAKPGYLQLASIAQEHYKVFMFSINDKIKDKIDIYDNDVSVLKSLHQLDASIPSEPDESIPIAKKIDYEKLPNKGCPMEPSPHGKKISDQQLGQILSGVALHVNDVVARFGNPVRCEPDLKAARITYWWKRSGKKEGESGVIFDTATSTAQDTITITFN